MSRSSDASKRSSAASKNASAVGAWFEGRVVPAMRRFGEFAYVAAVRDALPYSFGVLLVALIAIFPFTPSVGPLFGRGFGIRLSLALLPAFGIMAPTLAIALAVVYARKAAIGIVPMVLGSVAAFALSLPRIGALTPLSYLRALGPSGLFLAMLTCGMLALSIALTRRWLGSKPLSDWLGAALGVAIFAALALAHVSVSGAVTAAIVPLGRLGDSYAALMIIVLVETLLWTAGIHGPATLAAVVTPLYLALQTQNTDAFSHHHPLPHIVVVSLFLFVFPGGAGATLPLAALLAFSRIPRLRRIGRIAAVPAIFNINEPLIFGAPVVFNPYLAIPFIGVPLILATVTYVSVALGWVARPALYVPSSIPSVLSTLWATYDPRAVVLVLINIAIAAVLYVPFVRAYERHLEAEA